MLALPLVVAACTSEEEILTEKANSQYANIPTVETNFNWGTDTRLASEWGLEEGDVVGLAWLGIPESSTSGKADASYGGASLAITGNAYQNHPLYATASGMLQPETSIYVGKYFSYLPYDYLTVNIGAINFSVANQKLVDANIDANAWNKTAAQSIWISPKWTDVTLAGDIYGNNQAGVEETFDIYPRKFSNGVALNFDYKYNTPATGDVEIYGITVGYKSSGSDQAVTAFSYAPITEDAANAGDDTYWSAKKIADVTAATPTTGVVTLTPDAVVATTNANNTGKFYFNALPAETALTATDEVEIVITSTYGVVTINKAVNEIAYTNEGTGYKENADGNTENAVTINESFVNKLYKNGKFVAEVDFREAVMDGMHVKDDPHLQKMLNYYNEVKKGKIYAESKPSQTDIKLYLDPNANGEFELSLTSIELLQKINEGCSYSDKNISIQPCNVPAHGNVPTEIVVIGADNEIPNMDLCFDSSTAVTLRGTWNWNNNEAKNTWWVGPFYNEGVINVEATNVETDQTSGTLNNTALGTINVNSVVNWKVETTNYGTINIAEDTELRVYGTTLTNDATSLTAYGKIENSGVLGVVAGTTTPAINNYGYIKNNLDAKTYVTTNQTSGADFVKAFNASSNKIGVIQLTTATDNVSVSNATNTGFIKYTWDDAANEDGKYVTPSVDVKYNYLIVTQNIELVDAAPEIQYIEIAGGQEVVITCKETSAFHTTRTQGSATIDDRIGFILKEGQKANIKEGNILWTKGAFLKGTLYLGGNFANNSNLTTYFGGNPATDINNIIRY